MRWITLFYNIAGIILGLLLLLSTCLTFQKRNQPKGNLMVGIIFSLGFIGSGIGGFFTPKNLEYITIILLLFFSIGYLILYYLILKERNHSNQTKINSRK